MDFGICVRAPPRIGLATSEVRGRVTRFRVTRNQGRQDMAMSRRNFLTVAAATAASAASAPLATAADKFGRDRDWTGDTPVTYPEPAWEVQEKRFTGVQGNATLQRLWHGTGNDRALWCEGPVCMGDWGSLIWSDIPNPRTLRWTEDDGRGPDAARERHLVHARLEARLWRGHRGHRRPPVPCQDHRVRRRDQRLAQRTGGGQLRARLQGRDPL